MPVHNIETSLITYIEDLLHYVESGDMCADDAYHNMLLVLEGSLTEKEFDVLDAQRTLTGPALAATEN